MSGIIESLWKAVEDLQRQETQIKSAIDSLRLAITSLQWSGQEQDVAAAFRESAMDAHSQAAGPRPLPDPDLAVEVGPSAPKKTPAPEWAREATSKESPPP